MSDLNADGDYKVCYITLNFVHHAFRKHLLNGSFYEFSSEDSFFPINAHSKGIFSVRMVKQQYHRIEMISNEIFRVASLAF